MDIGMTINELLTIPNESPARALASKGLQLLTDDELARIHGGSWSTAVAVTTAVVAASAVLVTGGGVLIAAGAVNVGLSAVSVGMGAAAGAAAGLGITALMS